VTLPVPGKFMLLFGLLLLKIHTGVLPYNPDSTYGPFLVIVSFQTISMGKGTPLPSQRGGGQKKPGAVRWPDTGAGSLGRMYSIRVFNWIS
jgi:hypothetical protein